MVIKSTDSQKLNGVFYTPSFLARLLVEPLIQNRKLDIFDPAYGDGALLLASEQIHKMKFAEVNRSNLGLFGSDIAPVNGLLSHLPGSNLSQKDFFEYPIRKKFDIVVMNPPYVRHHYLSKEKIIEYKHSLEEKTLLSNRADLWSYFVLKTTRHLKKGGAVGAILPWSFLHAEYARALRQWLTQKFGRIELLSINEPCFDKANERILLLWLRDFGEKCNSIKVAEVDHPNNRFEFVQLSLDKWLSPKVVLGRSDCTFETINTYKSDFGFTEFNSIADIKLGVVTGANEFFVISTENANKFGLPKANLIPVVTGSKGLKGLAISDNTLPKWLFAVKPNEGEKFEAYISSGEALGIHERHHPRNRHPWYVLKVGAVPDAFFPYRILHIPYLFKNDTSAQSTNSVHRVYFKNVSETQLQWLQVCSLSVPFQLSIESNSRIYGKGVLKVELSALKRALVFFTTDPCIVPVYDSISHCLRAGNKIEAVHIATEFLNAYLGIPSHLASVANNALLELQKRRGAR
ncbi:MAG: hypothetical protein CL946_12805 [Ectothiorhodospiraceae bacterium]|nr:hypothetical protein [Ectothiorhodospiraceae bacterium]